jgi:hypothetical protein
MLCVLEAVVPYTHKHFSYANSSSKQIIPRQNPVSSGMLPEISTPFSCTISHIQDATESCTWANIMQHLIWVRPEPLWAVTIII